MGAPHSSVRVQQFPPKQVFSPDGFLQLLQIFWDILIFLFIDCVLETRFSCPKIYLLSIVFNYYISVSFFLTIPVSTYILPEFSLPSSVSISKETFLAFCSKKIKLFIKNVFVSILISRELFDQKMAHLFNITKIQGTCSKVEED